MSAKLVIEIDCNGTVFSDGMGRFRPEPELVSILVQFCAGALVHGLAAYHGRNIPIKSTDGQPVGQARLTQGE